MFFDLTFIEKIIDPAILNNRSIQHKAMTFEQAVVYFNKLGLLYELEERRSILEYDGGLDGNKAEEQAVIELMNRKEYYGQIGN